MTEATDDNKDLKPKYPKSQTADIALLIEGAYPFIKGGVSSWVNSLIRSFPEYRFAVIFLGTNPDDYDELCYSLPSNVVHLEPLYLFVIDNPPVLPSKGDDKILEKIEAMHEWFKNPDTPLDEHFSDVASYIEKDKGFDHKQFLYSKESWDFIADSYMQYCTDPSFVDYFWTIRNIHIPIWKLASIIANFPKVQVLHAVSTGYAGLLGVFLKQRYQYPLILTEHGIYTKERRIELLQSRILNDFDPLQRTTKNISYLRGLWTRFFETISRLCYSAADPILCLYSEAKDQQIKDGANPNRIKIIPNGVIVPKLKELREQRSEQIPPIICLMGRVVEIKDVKSFIRTIKLIINEVPSAEGWIAGPLDEDPEYVEDCKKLIKNLDLEQHVKILGYQNVADLFPKVGLLMLTSISEGMPLVVLEGFAAGIPAVLADVGACRDLILGNSDEDKALGSAGAIVQIANPQAFAREGIKLLTDSDAWYRAQAAGIARVEKYYDRDTMVERYKSIYSEVVQ